MLPQEINEMFSIWSDGFAASSRGKTDLKPGIRIQEQDRNDLSRQRPHDTAQGVPPGLPAFLCSLIGGSIECNCIRASDQSLTATPCPFSVIVQSWIVQMPCQSDRVLASLAVFGPCNDNAGDLTPR